MCFVNSSLENSVTLYVPQIITIEQYRGLKKLHKWINESQMRGSIQIVAVMSQLGTSKPESFDDDMEDNLMKLINFYKENNRIRVFSLEGERHIELMWMEEELR